MNQPVNPQHVVLLEKLDETDSSWSHAVSFVATVRDLVVVSVSLTLKGITRAGLGTSNGTNGGEVVKEAEYKALESAAAKFPRIRNPASPSQNVAAQGRRQ